MKHVHSHLESNLSRQILDEQLSNDWVGLSQDTKTISAELGISGVFDRTISKQKFKHTVKSACSKGNDEFLIGCIKTYKKMKALQDEIVKGNEYFYRETLYNVRMLFKFRVEHFEAKRNFGHKKEYQKEKFMCDSCESQIDENTHVLFRPSYKTLREGKNLNNDSDLANYLYKVLNIRMKLRLDR